MYERMLNKQETPTIDQMTAHCGACAELFTRKNKKLIYHVFAEENAFTVMVRLSDKQFDSLYGKVQTSTQEQIDHKYPRGNGGWLHYRVTCREQFEDIQILLTAKCA